MTQRFLRTDAWSEGADSGSDAAPLVPIPTLPPEPPADAPLSAREGWLKVANFALMAVALARTRGAPAAAEDATARLGPLVAAHRRVLSPLLRPEAGAAETFAVAKSFFTALAAADALLASNASLRRDVAAVVAPLAAEPERASDPLRLSSRNNHLLMRAAALALWANIDGDAGMMDLARAHIDRFVGQIDADGFFPSEIVRGASALAYSNLAVMLLVTLTRIGAIAGEALVDRAVLERAIAALAAGVEDPTIVHHLARKNMFPNPAHGPNPFATDLTFLRGYHSSRHLMSWVPLAHDLLGPEAVPAVLARALHTGEDLFPWGSEFVGGFVDALPSLGDRAALLARQDGQATGG
ncbi:alginate lyase family protein [Acuticoccus mangrovi]|uniref:Alginate lyase family protein n=1 Tax=Acuticoccus mangrovi TaxID=2796142 RepID=A0A934IRF6_9HYPH|nr:alginate lyase family protein [Acuticoccus mangrovi]MBJ3777351.1 alginate lyase family protein [Acuticoccus mangrovi]